MSEISKEALAAACAEKIKQLEFSVKQSAFDSVRQELETELAIARVALLALRERPDPVEPVWRAEKYPVNRPVPGSQLIVWDEAGKFVGYGSAVDARESGVAIQMSDGRRFDSNHTLRWEYALQAPPAPVVPKIDRKAICNKAHWLCARSPGATFYNAAEFALDEVMELLVPPATVVPEGLRIALSNAGIAAPESDEMLWASQQDYIQMLVTWVKDRKPFKHAPVVPDEVLKSLDLLLRRSYFRRWVKDPQGYVSGSIPVRDLVNVVLFADACRAAMLAEPGKN
ncbi:hypothetical protein [Cronobacter malonaticus]|uniref:hypothetical protein n=1 Tax=Cronobacter malonaticus TaxID=413503 RepID=UPI000CFE0669|nr:hypothetical protein [Cronobacter malonaticus]MDI7684830.1 hypothetical protein [Cronobacter malonaticus]